MPGAAPAHRQHDPLRWAMTVSATSCRASVASVASASHVGRLERNPYRRSAMPRRSIIRDMVASLITPFQADGSPISRRFPCIANRKTH